jgi:hypothetical protein
MNAVEIEEAVSALAMAPSDGHEFPFQFLTAFGNKYPMLKRLRTRASNTTDVAGAVLQRAYVRLAMAGDEKAGANGKWLPQ